MLAVCRGLQVHQRGRGRDAHPGHRLGSEPGARPPDRRAAVCHRPRGVGHARLCAVERHAGTTGRRRSAAGQQPAPPGSQADGPGFDVCATAPDGIIEAIERPNSRFCIAVQWHPENFWRTGEFRSLFEEFVKASETYVRRRPASAGSRTSLLSARSMFRCAQYSGITIERLDVINARYREQVERFDDQEYRFGTSRASVARSHDT